MRDKLEQLAKASEELEPRPEVRNTWHEQVRAYAHDYIDSLPTRKAFTLDESHAEGILNFQPGDKPRPMEEVLDILRRHLTNSGLRPASGGHLGYIPGGGIYPGALGDYIAAVTNEYAGVFFSGPAAVRIENMVIRWMCKIVGFPETALGNLTSGGSIANLIAFVTARDSMHITPEKVRKSVVYLTGQVHHCVHKAIRIGGMAQAIIRQVPMDEHLRMDATKLAELTDKDIADGLNPFLVVASAGTTNTGSMDPLNKIASICEEHKLWFHVDAAYGGFFLLADVENPDGSTVKQQFKGIERADSIAIDPHKGLFLPYGLGTILVKNMKAELESHYYQASYLQDALAATEEPSPADLSPELTKHWRGLRLWLPLQLYGVAPFKAALEEKILLCRYFYQEIQKLGFEVGPFPDLSVCTYRFVPKSGDVNEFNRRLVDYVQCDGRIFVSSTTIDGQVWIRLAVLSFRTHLREIDILLEIFKNGTEALSQELS